MEETTFQVENEAAVVEATAAGIHYFSTKRMEHMVIESCEADLAIIINAVAYYAEAMAGYLGANTDNLSICERYRTQSQYTRAKSVQKYLEEQTGYSREEALERCRKRSGVSQDTGGDAFELAVGKRNAGRKAS